MFGASVKLWQMEGEEEFSLIITHNPSVREFIMEVLELFKTELLVEEVVVEKLANLIPPSFFQDCGVFEESWSTERTSLQTMAKIQSWKAAQDNQDAEMNDLNGNVEKLELFKSNFHTSFDTEDFKSYPSLTEFCKENNVEHSIETDFSVIDHFIEVNEVGEQEAKFEGGNNSEVMISNVETDPVSEYLKSIDNTVRDPFSRKKHECSECPRTFSTNHELRSHSLIHSGEKPLICDFCGKGFRQRATLDRHKITHESDRNFDCDVCHKKFKFKHYLAQHKLLHTGVKPHGCTWCGLRFAQNANLQKHIRTQHTNDRSHKCQFCGKGFVQAYYLRRHLNSHKEAYQDNDPLGQLAEYHTGSDQMIGIRVVACLLCSVTCKGEKELENHMRKHHDHHFQMDTEVKEDKLEMLEVK